jgi:hypothetical protein
VQSGDGDQLEAEAGRTGVPGDESAVVSVTEAPIPDGDSRFRIGLDYGETTIEPREPGMTTFEMPHEAATG